MTAPENLPDVPIPLALDPFAFHGNPSSNIIGLGGLNPPPDPTYGFHTEYVPVSRGHAHFTVKFDQLAARKGTLWLRIHMLPNDPGAVARMVTGHRVQLNWLAHHGGSIDLRFEAFRGATYSIMGVVPDQTDASALGLSVILDRPASAAELADSAGVQGETQATTYGSAGIKTTALLLSSDQSSFSLPVSQAFTTDQLRDRNFLAWSKRLHASAGDPSKCWQSAYVLQVLDRYGMLQPAARGLMLGADAAAISTILGNDGVLCQAVALEPSDIGTEESWIDPAGLPGDLFAFDFLLSIRATDRLGTGDHAVNFLERVMECLRPGGLAVHVVGYRASGEKQDVAFDRNGLERIALGLISRGHVVARLKLPQERKLSDIASNDSIPFGIIARRGSISL